MYTRQITAYNFFNALVKFFFLRCVVIRILEKHSRALSPIGSSVSAFLRGNNGNLPVYCYSEESMLLLERGGEEIFQE